MKKILFASIALVCFATSIFSQLSTRENDAQILKLGTRPSAGDMALTFQGDILNGSAASLYNSAFLSPGDLLTFKVFQSSDIAYRIAFRFYNETEGYDGDAFTVDTIGAPSLPLQYKVSSSEYLIAPGIEKHFMGSNIFDVYVGAEVVLGMGKDKEHFYEEYELGDYYEYTATTSNFVAGVGGIVGVNVFLGQLPVSVGIEYGIGLKYSTAGKTHIIDETSLAGLVETYDYYTYGGTLPIGFGTRFEKLKSSNFGMDTNQNVRVVLNIYFSR